jgi:SSS family solute:Na+ symporter
VAILYLVLGGLWAAIFSDMFQYALFTLGYVVVVVLVVLRAGVGTFVEALPADYFNPLPGGPVPAIDWTASSVFGLFFLMICLAFGGTYWHRAVSSRSPNEATKGWLFGALLAVPFALVMPLAGMYVFAQGIELDTPQQAFGAFISEVNPWVGALMLTGVLAATMSTVEAGVVAGTTILFRDVIERIRTQRFSRSATVWGMRLLTFLYGVTSVAGAILFNRAVPETGALLGLAFLSAFSASLLPSMLVSMFARKLCSKEAALSSVLAGTAYTLYSLVSGTYVTYHPMLIGFIIATLVFAVVTGIVRATGPWWGRSKREEAESVSSR